MKNLFKNVTTGGYWNLAFIFISILYLIFEYSSGDRDLLLLLLGIVVAWQILFINRIFNPQDYRSKTFSINFEWGDSEDDDEKDDSLKK